MTCQELRRLVSHSGEVAPAFRQLLQAHLAGCAACGQWLWEREPVLGLILSLPQTGFEDERFVGEVLAGIHQRQAEQAVLPKRSSKLWKVAAVLALTSLLGLWAGHHRQNSTLAQRQDLAPASSSEPFVEVEGEGVRVYHLVTGDEGQAQVAFIVSPTVEL